MKTKSGILLPHEKSGTYGDEHEYERHRPSGPDGPTLFIPKVPQDQNESYEYSWDGYVSYLGSGKILAKAFYEGSKKTAKNEEHASHVVEHPGVPMAPLDKLPVGQSGQMLGPGGWEDPGLAPLPKPHATIPWKPNWEPISEFPQNFPAYQELLGGDNMFLKNEKSAKTPVKEEPPPEPPKNRLDCLEFVLEPPKDRLDCLEFI